MFKDQKFRLVLKQHNKKYFILKSITQNSNLFFILRKQASKKLDLIHKQHHTVGLVNCCVYTFNKKRFSKVTVFSRMIYSNLIKSGNMPGFKKSSW